MFCPCSRFVSRNIRAPLKRQVGYRVSGVTGPGIDRADQQRIGLAQALINDPEVLILDEPTSGLDPNQLVGIRQLIREIGSEKTLIFSSHIMQEVQALCDRVIILSKGRLVADAPIAQLMHLRGNGLSIIVEFTQPVPDEFFTGISGITRRERLGKSSRCGSSGCCLSEGGCNKVVHPRAARRKI